MSAATRCATLSLFLSLLLISCAAARRPGPAPAATLADADAKLARLRPVLRGYPPRVGSEEERRQVARLWQQTEAELNQLAEEYPDDPTVQWRLGELYRFGHDLDVPEAGSQCVEHLQRAIALRPNYVDAYLELGLFYSNAGIQWARLGERHLKKAIELSAPKPLPRAWRALAITHYYQGKFNSSVSAADTYLSLVPNDDEMRDFRSIALRALASGARGGAPTGRAVPFEPN